MLSLDPWNSPAPLHLNQLGIPPRPTEVIPLMLLVVVVVVVVVVENEREGSR